MQLFFKKIYTPEYVYSGWHLPRKDVPDLNEGVKRDRVVDRGLEDRQVEGPCLQFAP